MPACNLKIYRGPEHAAVPTLAKDAAGKPRVTVPLSLPGAIAAFFMVFIPTVGEYITPMLVGGPGGAMYGNIIQDFFTRAANWPLGSALSVVMLVTTLVFTAIALRLINVRRFLVR